MRQGKLTNAELREYVLSALGKTRRAETAQRSNVGADCAALDLGGRLCVLSTDPITASAHDAGALSISVSANDVAASGAEPLAALLTLLAPPDTALEEIRRVVEQAAREAEKHNIEIIGGHTEWTDAVNRVVLSATVIGAVKRADWIPFDGAKAGDALIMTKYAGLEGTLLLLRDRAEELKKVGFTDGDLAQADDIARMLDVVDEGAAAARLGASAMHDITEGGALGAAWEMAEAAGLGVAVDADKIPLLPITAKIRDALGVDPLRLIGSGALLIAHGDPETLLRALFKMDIPAIQIGEFHARKEKFVNQCGKVSNLAPPESDAIFINSVSQC